MHLIMQGLITTKKLSELEVWANTTVDMETELSEIQFIGGLVSTLMIKS